jgi:hypothetical protein
VVELSTPIREAIHKALSSAEYPMTAGEIRCAVRTVGVFGEDYLREHLAAMRQAGEVEREQPHEKEFWYLVPPPWAADGKGERP